MGNRAVITNKPLRQKNVGVYLHWNGGRDSVEAFLHYCKIKGYRTDDYGYARLAQIIGNFFGGTTSVGIGVITRMDCDNYDNGTYLIKNWEIVGRKYMQMPEQYEYDLEEMLIGIDKAQPIKEQVGVAEIKKYLDSR